MFYNQINPFSLRESSNNYPLTTQFSLNNAPFPNVFDALTGPVKVVPDFGGIAFPFLRERLRGQRDVRFVAAEPAACPTLTRGVYRYDYGDTAGLTPLTPESTPPTTQMPAGTFIALPAPLSTNAGLQSELTKMPVPFTRVTWLPAKSKGTWFQPAPEQPGISDTRALPSYQGVGSPGTASAMACT